MIPTRTVRKIDSPWDAACGVQKAACAELPEPPAVWTQQRPWDPHRNDVGVEAAPSHSNHGQRRKLDRLHGPAVCVDTEGYAMDNCRDIGPTQGYLALTSGGLLCLVFHLFLDAL